MGSSGESVPKRLAQRLRRIGALEALADSGAPLSAEQAAGCSSIFREYAIHGPRPTRVSVLQKGVATQASGAGRS